MGCSCSSSQPTIEPKKQQVQPVQQVAQDRRRLTVGSIEEPGSETAKPTEDPEQASGQNAPTSDEQPEAETTPKAQENEPADEEDVERGLITNVHAADVLQMLDVRSAGRTRWSVGSGEDLGLTTFANKNILHIGDELDPLKHGLGFTCRKGLKPESPNQDSWSVLKIDQDLSIYGVYDGHGQKGHDVSNFVKENLPKLILGDNRLKGDQMPQMLHDAFLGMQRMVIDMDDNHFLNAQLSGTTASVVIHDHVKNKITVSHVADSTVVLGRFISADRNPSQLEAVQLTRDHKPDLPDERQRIEDAGGRVVFDGYSNHRVYARNARYPGLNMSRCLGDLLGHSQAGCSCTPEVSERDVTDLDHVLLVCSDGVWEFISPQEAVNIISEYGSGMAMVAANKLAQAAWDRWVSHEGGVVVDDITVVLIYLQHGKPAAELK